MPSFNLPFLVEANMIKFGGYQNLTLQDYPDQVAAMLFTSGCNMRCPYCHNPHLVFDESPGLLLSEVRVLLNKWEKQDIKHIVITGGEPTIYKGLLAFIEDLRRLGFKVKLDTNGHNLAMVKDLVERGLIGYVALDIKPDMVELSYYEPILNHLFQLRAKGVSNLGIELRTTVTTALTLGEFLQVGDFLSYLNIPPSIPYYLQTFVDNGDLLGGSDIQGYTLNTMEGFASSLKQYGINAIVR